MALSVKTACKKVPKPRPCQNDGAESDHDSDEEQEQILVSNFDIEQKKVVKSLPGRKDNVSSFRKSDCLDRGVASYTHANPKRCTLFHKFQLQAAI